MALFRAAGNSTETRPGTHHPCSSCCSCSSRPSAQYTICTVRAKSPFQFFFGPRSNANVSVNRSYLCLCSIHGFKGRDVANKVTVVLRLRVNLWLEDSFTSVHERRVRNGLNLVGRRIELEDSLPESQTPSLVDIIGGDQLANVLDGLGVAHIQKVALFARLFEAGIAKVHNQVVNRTINVVGKLRHQGVLRAEHQLLGRRSGREVELKPVELGQQVLRRRISAVESDEVQLRVVGSVEYDLVVLFPSVRVVEDETLLPFGQEKLLCLVDESLIAV
mmetsp:Transcript_40732/g.161460  ORF Transcript_40732/g.161460 Transcript_40732/m.161460 type:complete len:276 (-) Transcript_40732:1015-1842(-)